MALWRSSVRSRSAPHFMVVSSMIQNDFFGLLGMITLLGAFYLGSNNYLTEKSCFYHFLNLIGAILVGINAFYHNVMAVAALEFVWFIISLVGIGKVWLYRRDACDLE